jgi:ATP-binding cassette, subfamily B, bacterial
MTACKGFFTAISVTEASMLRTMESMPDNTATHRQVLAFVWCYVRRYKLLLGVMIVFLLLSTALQLLQPFFYKVVVDTIASGIAKDMSILIHLSVMVLIGVLCGVLHLTFHTAASRMFGWVVTRTMQAAHADVFAHVQRLSTRFHVNAFAGSTARKIGRGTDSIETIIDRIWFNFLPLGMLTIGFMIVLGIVAPMVGMAIVGGILLYVPVSVWLNLQFARRQSWTDRQDTRVTASMVDAITGNASVKAFSAEHREEERHGGVLGEWLRRFWLLWKFGTFITWIQFMLIMLIELLLLLLAVWLWFQGMFTAGDFILVMFYVGKLWGYMFDIGHNVRQYVRAVSHVEEMVGLYRTPLGVSDHVQAEKLSVMKGAIAFQDVSFSYEQAEQSVFQYFSVDIEAGEKVALVGHSGGGKTTFVKILQRLYDLDSGRIMIDGQDIAGVTQESLRRAIGLVPQDPVLFHRSLAENISYGKPHASRKEIEEAAQKAHAHEFIKDFPKGYDEATSSLDSHSEKYIQEALEYLMEGRTTIVIAHRLSTIKKADRIFVIEKGEMVEEGSHAALIRKKDGVYRGFYELQAGGFIGE